MTKLRKHHFEITKLKENISKWQNLKKYFEIAKFKKNILQWQNLKIAFFK